MVLPQVTHLQRVVLVQQLGLGLHQFGTHVVHLALQLSGGARELLLGDLAGLLLRPLLLPRIEELLLRKLDVERID